MSDDAMMTDDLSWRDFGDAMKQAFKKFGKVTTDDVGEAAKYAAKEALKTLRETKPYKSHTGDYKASFGSEVAYKDTYAYGMRIGARGPYYRLTHLLEKGHRLRGGSGKTRSYPHIAPAQEAADKAFEEKIKELIGSHDI